MTEKSVMIPGLTMGNMTMDLMADDEMVRNIMEALFINERVQHVRIFREVKEG